MANITTKERQELCLQGFAIELVANQMHLTMIESIDKLLNENETFINATISHLVPNNTSPVAVLQHLSKVFHELPHNYDDDTVFYAVWGVVSAVIVALRFYARKFVTPKALHREDWVCLITLIFAILVDGCMFAQNTLGGAGHHLWDAKLRQYINIMHVGTYLIPLFAITHILIRLNFLVFYHRLSPSKNYRRCVYAITAFTFTSIWLFFIALLGCKPFDWWNHSLTAKCIDRLAAFTWYTVQIMTADVLILLLPIYPVMKLNLKSKDKIMLLGIFSLGILITVTSLLRMIALRKWFNDADWTYEIQGHSRWLVVEIFLAVIVACAPAIKVLFFHRSPDKVPGLSKIQKYWRPGGIFKGTLKTFGFKSTVKQSHADGTRGATQLPPSSSSKATGPEITSLEQIDESDAKSSHKEKDVEMAIVSEEPAE